MPKGRGRGAQYRWTGSSSATSPSRAVSAGSVAVNVFVIELASKIVRGPIRQDTPLPEARLPTRLNRDHESYAALATAREQRADTLGKLAVGRSERGSRAAIASPRPGRLAARSDRLGDASSARGPPAGLTFRDDDLGEHRGRKSGGFSGTCAATERVSHELVRRPMLSAAPPPIQNTHEPLLDGAAPPTVGPLACTGRSRLVPRWQALTARAWRRLSLAAPVAAAASTVDRTERRHRVGGRAHGYRRAIHRGVRSGRSMSPLAVSAARGGRSRFGEAQAVRRPHTERVVNGAPRWSARRHWRDRVVAPEPGTRSRSRTREWRRATAASGPSASKAAGARLVAASIGPRAVPGAGGRASPAAPARRMAGSPRTGNFPR
jgi:hypothetical protein